MRARYAALLRLGVIHERCLLVPGQVPGDLCILGSRGRDDGMVQ